MSDLSGLASISQLSTVLQIFVQPRREHQKRSLLARANATVRDLSREVFFPLLDLRANREKELDYEKELYE
jgi:hypothetical protein